MASVSVARPAVLPTCIGFSADLFARGICRQIQGRLYDLGALNLECYEDIAEFFSVDVKTIDGKPIYGHMDYGKKDPLIGWRFTDAWLHPQGMH
jgi:glycerol transport system substrate-binding protein